MRTTLIRFLLLFGFLLAIVFIYDFLTTQAEPESKERESPFAYLWVSDSSLVHIRRGTTELLTDWDYEPADLLSWQLHLPEGKQWRVCWAFGKFPIEASLPPNVGSRELPSTAAGEHPEFRLSFQRNGESGWNASFLYGTKYDDARRSSYDHWLVPMPAEQGSTIWMASRAFVTVAGQLSKEDAWVTKTFPGDEPIVILRLGEAEMDGLSRNSPYNGIVVWIEQASDGKNADQKHPLPNLN